MFPTYSSTNWNAWHNSVGRVLMGWCAKSSLTSLPRVNMTSPKIPSIPSKHMRPERQPTYPSTLIITSTEPGSRERGLHGYEWLGGAQAQRRYVLADGHHTPPGLADRRGTLCDEQFRAR